jgi:signal transduction histidine kinase
MRRRIFIGVLITLIFAMVSLHLLVGKRAVNPLLEEVTARRVQTVALIATAVERAPKPKRVLKKLSEGFDVELKLVPEAKFWKKYDKRIAIKESGRQFVMNGHQITTFKQPKAPLFTTLDIDGESMVLVVSFSMDMDQIKQRRGVDFALIMAVLMIFSAIISHWAFNPLRRATVAMGEIADGNLEHRVEDNIGPAKEAFNHMADRVEQMLEGQRMLLAGISHELRTPLARMKLQAALLDSKIDTTSLHEDIEEMDALVEMLLVSSQLQSGSFEIRPERIVIQELIFEVLAGVDLADRYIALDIDSSTVLRADRLLIKRVMLNLLSNVAKYTPEDCTVSIGAKRVENTVEISVLDTGDGLSDEKLTHLLEPFWRADKSRTKEEDSKTGWGLGLSFVQRVIEGHNGTVELSHNHPTGLTVLLTIPISN